MANLDKTPSGMRVHIGFFGRRNAGKSSIVNALTGQELSIVSDVLGTTTDPVTKAMELLPLGPVVIIDTSGIDDSGEVGELRVKRSYKMLNKCDIAVIVVDAVRGADNCERELAELCRAKNIPCITVYNKCDAEDALVPGDALAVSAVSGEGIDTLKARLASAASNGAAERRIIGDRLSEGDVVILVTPIDASAPKGRMILPQVQTMRDILDSHAICMTSQTEQLPQLLSALSVKPRLVITDSQVFGRVKGIVPENVPLTSFSILMAAYKGMLGTAVRGACAIDRLKSGSRVLISEGCTHHRQCEDIGTVKLPAWIRKHAGTEEIIFDFTSGGDFPESLDGYDIVIHCGGCMLGEREVSYRARCAEDAGIPFTNYGTAIAYMNGILKRSLSPFPSLAALV